MHSFRTNPTRIRLATYNIHKCRGLDGRVRPQRIVEVLREVDADVIALQEVLSIAGARSEDDQARFIAAGLGFGFVLGSNRHLRGGSYGNVVLSRYAWRQTRDHDISVRGREQRGCLRVDVELAGGILLHVFNVHLGTSYFERRRQAALLWPAVMNDSLTGPRAILGDFNEWKRGLVSQSLSRYFQAADIRAHLGRSRTYPGLIPLLHLDHMYFDPEVRVEKMVLHRSRTALLASDHLPLVAHLRVAN